MTIIKGTYIYKKRKNGSELIIISAPIVKPFPPSQEIMPDRPTDRHTGRQSFREVSLQISVIKRMCFYRECPS